MELTGFITHDKKLGTTLSNGFHGANFQKNAFLTTLQNGIQKLGQQREKIERYMQQRIPPRPLTEAQQFRYQTRALKKAPAKHQEINKSRSGSEHQRDTSEKLTNFIDNVMGHKQSAKGAIGKCPMYKVLPLPQLQRTDLHTQFTHNENEVNTETSRIKRVNSRKIETPVPKSCERRSTNPLPLAENLQKVEDLPASIEDYVLGSQLGRGSYATVRLATHKRSSKTVAIKIYEKYRLSTPQRRSCVNREISIMKRTDHPNIVKLFDTFSSPRQLFLVMEFVRGKSLLSYVKGQKRLSESDAMKIFCQVLSGLSYLHSHNIAHRDIKMENILLDKNMNAKIIDFGFGAFAPPTHKLKIFCGTPSYMAPEIVNKREYIGPPVDMWSLGVLLYVMLCGAFPFRGSTELELYRSISKGLYSTPSFVPLQITQLITKLLNLNPQRRYSSSDISKLPIVVNEGIRAH